MKLRHANVEVEALSIPLEDTEMGRQNRACGYGKMEVLGKGDANQVNRVIKKKWKGHFPVYRQNIAFVDISDISNTSNLVVSNRVTYNVTLKMVRMEISKNRRSFGNLSYEYARIPSYLTHQVHLRAQPKILCGNAIRPIGSFVSRS